MVTREIIEEMKLKMNLQKVEPTRVLISKASFDALLWDTNKVTQYRLMKPPPVDPRAAIRRALRRLQANIT